MQPTTGSRRPPLMQFLRIGIASLVLIGVGMLAFDVWSYGQAVDRRAHLREEAKVRQGLFLLGEAIVAENLVLANEPETRKHIQGSVDRDWIEREFWSQAMLDSGESAYLVSGNGASVLSGRRHPSLPTELHQDDLAALQPTIQKLDQAFRSQGEKATERLFAGLYAHGLALIGDRPSLVSAIAVSPSLATVGTAASKAAILVRITPIDGRVERQLAGFAQIAGVRLVAAPVGFRSLDAHAPLTDLEGRPIGALAWHGERPAQAIFLAILPLVVASALLYMLHSLVTYQALRSMARQVLDREEKATNASRTDAATGLANRRWFHERFTELSADPEQSVFGLVLFDLDHFKSINDTLGHAAGDAVIKAVADRLLALPSGVELAARLGGDEFAVITTECNNQDALSISCEALREAIMLPVDFEGRSIPVSASIGSALWPDHSQSIDGLLAAADLALYRAKRTGRGRACVYDLAVDLPATLLGAKTAAEAAITGRAPDKRLRRQAA